MSHHGSHNEWLSHLGLNPETVSWFTPPVLVEHAIKTGEASLTDTGSLSVRTGRFTGRCPERRFIVNGGTADATIGWGTVNKPVSKQQFELLWERAVDHLKASGKVFGLDGSACADPQHAIGVRVLTTMAWQALFSSCMFRAPIDTPSSTLTILAVGEVPAGAPGSPEEPFIGLDLENGRVLILGTCYAGEIKKSVFSYLNWKLPGLGVLPMHCSATVGAAGDVALYFGLSGTGKTTLSADPARFLIGDDEHGWSEQGVFNFEGGCYAKTIKLTRQNEPLIWDSIGFGTVLENVPLDLRTRIPDFDSTSYTENTRVAYPLSRVSNLHAGGCAGHPANILFLTCDAYGVLPAVAKLDKRQALEQFLLGYTAKVGGTEAGVTGITATFSSGFGAPFLPRPSSDYARLLAEKLEKHSTSVWLINTGWSGGPAGSNSGKRMPLSLTRSLVDRILSGSMDAESWQREPVFGLLHPIQVDGIEDRYLDPRSAWIDNNAYDVAARQLADQFAEKLNKHSSVLDSLA